MDSGIRNAKIKRIFNPWHKYLEGKTLIVGKMFDDYNLIGIVGETEGIKNLCNYCYRNNKKVFEESGYDSLMSWIEDCELGNDGFGFKKDELEILPVWYLDERICDCEDCTNTQTYREFITEKENEFEIKHEPIDEYTDEELKKYLEFLDSLWDK